MKHSHVKWTGLAERITIQEAAGHVVEETGKSLDHTIAFLVDCAEQGYFAPDVVAHSDYANVSHISRVDPSKSTVSTAELSEWLDHEIEEALQKARESLASKESRKWGYPVKPDDLHVHLIPWSEQFDDLSRDDTISMTILNWVEYLTQEVAERQGWAGAEREAKCSVVRAEYLNLFVALASTLPLVQELTRSPWKGAKLLPDWLSSLHLVKADLREWAKIHAPEIAESRLLTDPTGSKSTPLSAPPVATTTERVTASAPPSAAHDVASKIDASAAIGNGSAEIQMGRNPKEVSDAYIEKRARDIHANQRLYRDDKTRPDTKEGIAAIIATEMKSKGFAGDRGRLLSAATIVKEIPKGLTGGYAKNGKKRG